MSNNPFDYFKSVSLTKENLIVDDQSEAAFIPFLVNRSLSYFTDTLFHANQINRMHNIDKKMQYDYLFTAIRSRKRFTKWAKPAKSEDIDAIKQYYKYTDKRAIEALSILTDQQVALIKKRLEKGGR